MSGNGICEAANKEKGMFDSDKSIAQKRDAGIAKEVAKFDDLSLPPVGKVYTEAVIETGDLAIRVGRVQAACAAEAGSVQVERFEPASAKLRDHGSNLCELASMPGASCDSAGTLGSTVAERRK